MKVIIDTSSWIAVVRYYLPFDQNGIISDFFKNKLNTKELVIIDKVFDECFYISKGIVIKELDFINLKKEHNKTDTLIPSKKFYNLLENQFCIQVQKRKLTDVQFENEKENYLKSADARIILQAIKYQKEDKENVIVVTEETSNNNDSKLFIKIPNISSILGINCITLPKLIDTYNSEITIEIK